MAAHDLFAGSECDRIFQGGNQARCNKVGKKLQIPPAQIDQNNLLLDEVSRTAVFLFAMEVIIIGCAGNTFYICKRKFKLSLKKVAPQTILSDKHERQILWDGFTTEDRFH